MLAAASIKVMVVDDQAEMRETVFWTLQDIGFRKIRSAAGALEALAAIQTDRVHLIISDYKMPGMDGLQFLEAVRKDPEIGKTVFIMLTGLGDRDLVQKAAALGVNSYLMKLSLQPRSRRRSSASSESLADHRVG